MKKIFKFIFAFYCFYLLLFSNKIVTLFAENESTSVPNVGNDTVGYTKIELIFYYCLFGVTFLVFIISLIKNKKNKNKTMYQKKCENISLVKNKVKNYITKVDSHKLGGTRITNSILIEINLIIDDIFILYGDTQEVYLSYSLENLRNARENFKSALLQTNKEDAKKDLEKTLEFLQRAIENIKTLDSL